MEAKACIPVLMSSTSRLTKPLDIIKYVLRSYMTWPKNISDTFNDREISFTYDVATIGWDSEALANRVRVALTGVLRYYFSNASAIEIDATVESVDEVNYNVKLSVVVVVDGVPVSFEDTQRVDDKGNLIYDFEGTEGV